MNNCFLSLELHKILEMLSAEASNEATKAAVAALEPVSDVERVKKEMRKTTDAFEMSVKYGTPVFQNFKDIRHSLERADAGASLSLRELMDIGQMLNQIRLLSEWYGECDEKDRNNSLSEFFVSLSPNKYLEDKIKGSVLSEDELADDASPELASIRRKISQAGIRIRETLDRMIKSTEVQKSLRDNIITMRDGRYVLPVKSEAKGSIPGLVHATSATGATFFIEPMSVVEANNDIKILQSQEQEEIERIIAELSAVCASHSITIAADFETCAELDLYFAKANLGAKMRASVPEISDDGQLELKKARHPLIDPKNVVAVDIKLGIDYNALIVTGPNTGGKTVLLKTTGLLTAMTMCGLMIPAADGSRVSVFENILVDIGDRQSIEQSLSTFSSHMSNVVEIISKANHSSLVLLDELGSGTDPIEGAALAVAIIEKLCALGSKLLVTTHYQELKLFAVQTDGVENASCEFDVATLRPTYRLIIGSPGKSNAFSISARLGIPQDVIERANVLVSSENQRFEEVIAQLEEARSKLERQNDEISSLKAEHARKLSALEMQIADFNARKDAEFENARVQAMRIVESCRMQAEELIDELSEIRKQKDRADFSQRSLDAKSHSRSALDKMYNAANPVINNSSAEEYKLPRPLKRGDTVLVTDINRKGTVAGDPDGDSVYVQVGIMKTKVSISKIRLAEPEKPKNAQQRHVSAKGVTSKLERRASLELDIRGCAVDEGIHELDMFLDNAVLSNAGIVTIIHGKGTGILRQGIQKHLKSHPNVKSFRSGVFGEGEEGVTVVELK